MTLTQEGSRLKGRVVSATGGQGWDVEGSVTDDGTVASDVSLLNKLTANALAVEPVRVTVACEN